MSNTFKNVTDHMVKVSDKMVPKKKGPLSVNEAEKHFAEIKEYFEDSL